MAFSEPVLSEGFEDDFQAVIDGLDREFGPMPWEPLCKAIRSGDMQTVGGSGLELQGRLTIPPKREAILAGRTDMLNLLLQRDSYIDEELVKVACDGKDRPSLRVLLDSGWPINHPIGDVSLLCTAIHDVAFTRWLVENGADVNLRSRNDETALSSAIAFGDINVVRFLFNHGTDHSRGDLVHCAAQRDDENEGAALIKVLAHKGANMNAHRYNNPSAFRWRVLFKSGTPLHIACQRGSVLVARALLEHGADPNQKMLEAQKLVSPTPHEIAMGSKNEDLMSLFGPI